MWLEWESNPRQTESGSVALTKLSYPVGDRAESNRVPANRRLPPAGDPCDGMSATSGIRHGNAARTSPWWKRDRWRIEGAGHRHYRRAIMFGCDADNVRALPVARSKSFGGAGKARVSERRVAARVQFWHRGSLCRRKKRPGTCVPRASSGLGDRGGRSPQGGYQAVVSWSSLPNARASTSMRRHGSSLAVATECAFKGSFQWLLKRGAHDKPRFSRAQPICSIIFFGMRAMPASGRHYRPSGFRAGGIQLRDILHAQRYVGCCQQIVQLFDAGGADDRCGD